ncbi:hypothetical protein Hamer_G020235 [Homarus americanus]|uniref:Uncharacterized protein n=1 Tax=Homarus americanus TaxID=6706 RepID=A0A8J5TJY7_HOMAM|nr:hypothetical protein Hamer_G020235 [Homarus americanus]
MALCVVNITSIFIFLLQGWVVTSSVGSEDTATSLPSLVTKDGDASSTALPTDNSAESLITEGVTELTESFIEDTTVATFTSLMGIVDATPELFLAGDTPVFPQSSFEMGVAATNAFQIGGTSIMTKSPLLENTSLSRESSSSVIMLQSSGEGPQNVTGGSFDEIITEYIHEAEVISETTITQSPQKYQHNFPGVQAKESKTEATNCIEENRRTNVQPTESSGRSEESIFGVPTQENDVMLTESPKEQGKDILISDIVESNIKFSSSSQNDSWITAAVSITEQISEYDTSAQKQTEIWTSNNTFKHHPWLTYPPKNNSECNITLGLRLYQMAHQAKTKLPQDCWKLLCSESKPITLFDTLHSTQTHWFKEVSPKCYTQLSPIKDVDSISKKAEVAPTHKFVVLNPSCVHSVGFALIQLSKNISHFLPHSCHVTLCNSGTVVVRFEKQPILLVIPNSLYNDENTNECFQKLTVATLSINKTSVNFGPRSDMIHLTDHPETSCSTVLVVTAVEDRTRIVLPLWKGGCSPFTEVTMRELLVSWFSLFQTGQHSQLCKCLLYKSVTQTSPLIWFSYIIQCSNSECVVLEEELKQCQRTVNGAKNLSIEAITPVWLTPSGVVSKTVFVLSSLWSCPGGNGDDQDGRSRAEILVHMGMQSEALLQACKPLKD